MLAIFLIGDQLGASLTAPMALVETEVVTQGSVRNRVCDAGRKFVRVDRKQLDRVLPQIFLQRRDAVRQRKLNLRRAEGEPRHLIYRVHSVRTVPAVGNGGPEICHPQRY